MRTWIYTVLVTRLFALNGFEYNVTTTSADVKCFNDQYRALEFIDGMVDTHLRRGYFIVDSDAPDDDVDYSFMCRLKDEQGHTVVLELAWKKVEGALFSYQDSSTMGPSKLESRPT